MSTCTWGDGDADIFNDDTCRTYDLKNCRDAIRDKYSWKRCSVVSIDEVAKFLVEYRSQSYACSIHMLRNILNPEAVFGGYIIGLSAEPEQKDLSG
jgi:hypothetical protein